MRNVRWDHGVHSGAPERAGVDEKRGQKRAMHPRNKYAEKAPDFRILASKYHSFSEFVTYGPNKKPRIDWTDFNATRELTRVLLEHDYGIKWWIPDGQLCPTVPSRANYIHWIEDLLSASPAPWHVGNPSKIRGVDIGTGANCIYPLLGATLNGWHFVATDITPLALEWAKRNVLKNPQLSEYIEVRRAGAIADEGRVSFGKQEVISGSLRTIVRSEDFDVDRSEQEVQLQVDEERTPIKTSALQSEHERDLGEECCEGRTEERASCELEEINSDVPQGRLDHISRDEGPATTSECGNGAPGNAPFLIGVIKECEFFDFCMCNPPFFESIEEAGLNPRTACGGTSHEMVYPGGELAFVQHIIEDSLELRNQIGWYTSMVGRKINIKILTAFLKACGVTVVRTTEFVQGRTSRWGIAWSFSPVEEQEAVSGCVLGKNSISFMLEGVGRKFSAFDVFQALADELRVCGAVITLDVPSFSLKGTVSGEISKVHAANDLSRKGRQAEKETVPATSKDGVKSGSSLLSFSASVFQQVPGTLLIKGSLPKTEGPSGLFASLFGKVELALKRRFLKAPARP